jgi:transcription elongation factor GreB
MIRPTEAAADLDADEALDDDEDEGDPSGNTPKAKTGGLNYISPQGLAKLQAERHQLHRVERPRVVGEVADAAAMGDRSENAEYIYGKRRLREIDRRMRFLQQRIDAAVVVAPDRDIDRERVAFGALVTLEAEDGAVRRWQIVGEDEVDLSHGKISLYSPIGAGLIGKRLGDEVTIRTPAGPRDLIVLAITWPDT